MKSSFRQSEVFPRVSRCIARAQGDASGFVSHDTIVTAILADPWALELVAEARKTSNLSGDPAIASNMLQWFSQRISVGRSPWTDFFDRERRANGWAYRPKTAVAPPIAPDLDLSAVEGDPRLFFHIRRERNFALAQAKKNAMRRADGHLICEVCGFLAPRVYPGISGDVCEVHHRLPLSEVADTVTTRPEDLALLCPNCHRAIHRTDPLVSVEDFRTTFFSKRGVEQYLSE